MSAEIVRSNSFCNTGFAPKGILQSPLARREWLAAVRRAPT